MAAHRLYLHDLKGLAARAGLLALLGMGAGLGWNAVRGRPLQPTQFLVPDKCEAAVSVQTDEIDVTDAARRCRRHDVLLADSRSATAYAEGHAAGAIHLPCDTRSEAIETRLAGARTIIVYGETTDSARPVAQALRERTQVEVLVLRGGFAAWDRASLACESGACTECRP